MKKTILIVLAVLAMLCAAAVTAYPVISNYVNDKYQSTIRKEYKKELSQIDDSAIEEARKAAQEYNDGLSPLRYNLDEIVLASEDYQTLLNPTGSGIMGYIEIPHLDIHLPIYHGTGEDVLEKGVGHLTGSSLPIGGLGCHSVLTGHSGVAGKRLFSDIDQMKPGDVFFLQVLDETLAYEVIEVNKVLPHETSLLAPVADADLCTLVTCYPYGVNTHRLLVRGVRIPYEEAQEIEDAAPNADTPQRSTWQRQYYTGLLIGGSIGILFLLIAVIVILIQRRRSRQKKTEDAK